jgi:hypothetical protein
MTIKKIVVVSNILALKKNISLHFVGDYILDQIYPYMVREYRKIHVMMYSYISPPNAKWRLLENILRF